MGCGVSGMTANKEHVKYARAIYRIAQAPENDAIVERQLHLIALGTLEENLETKRKGPAQAGGGQQSSAASEEPRLVRRSSTREGTAVVVVGPGGGRARRQSTGQGGGGTPESAPLSSAAPASTSAASAGDRSAAGGAVATDEGRGRVKSVLDIVTILDPQRETRYEVGAESLVHFACGKGRVALLRTFLAYKPNLGVENDHGFNALQLASICPSGDAQQCAELLVQNGADINKGTALVGSPLHLAAKHGNVLTVETLLKFGASKTALDPQGYTPADCVRQVLRRKRGGAGREGDRANLEDILGQLGETIESPRARS